MNTLTATCPVCATPPAGETHDGPEAVWVTRENGTSATIHLDRAPETPRTVEYVVMGDVTATCGGLSLTAR